MTPDLYDNQDCNMTTAFSNEQVLLDRIPTIATIEYSSLESALLKADLLWTVLFYGVIFIVTLLLRYVFTVDFMLIASIEIWVVMVVLFIVTVVFNIYAHRKKMYAIRQRDIIYNSGLFWQSSIVIPYNRVQHCEVSQGPIDRLFNLAEIKIYTAGGSSSDLSIGGLLPENAQRIKDFIVQKTAADEEE